jgi:hypothetical protein
MKTWNPFLLSAVLAATACNQAVETGPQPSDAPRGPKTETSTNGVLTKGDGPDITVVSNTALTKATNTPWIGLIPADDPASATCPEVWSAIRMDDEDHENANYLAYKKVTSTSIEINTVYAHNFSVGGFMHSSSPQVAGGNTWIHYCARQVNTLPSLAYDYAVISASNVCPGNSIRFTRRFDNEDDANHNATQGDITPNSSSTNGGATYLNFCFVPKAGTGAWDPMFDNQIILAPKGASSDMWVDLYTDDEDDANNNQWSAASGTSSDIQTRMKAIVPVGGNSHLYGMTKSDFTTLDMGTQTSCSSSSVNRCTYARFGDRSCAIWQPAKEKYDKVVSWLCSW